MLSRFSHEVYRTPLVGPARVRVRTTPDNYRRNFPGPGKLPDQMKVWRVQKAGRTSAAWSPAAMALRIPPMPRSWPSGFNRGKAYGDVGIGRQGNCPAMGLLGDRRPR